MSNLRTLTKSGSWETTHHGMIVPFSILILFRFVCFLVLFYFTEPGIIQNIHISSAFCILHIKKKSRHASAQATRGRRLEIGIKI